MAISSSVYPRLKVFDVGGTPTTGPFDIPFPFYVDETVSVFVDGVEVTEYTITKASEFGTEGNEVNFIDPVSNVQVIVQSTTSRTRSTGDTFVQLELSQELDRIFAIFQEGSENDERIILLPITSDLANLEYPNPAANAAIGWNATANGLTNITSLPDTVLSASTDNALLAYDLSTGGIQERSVTVTDSGFVTISGGASISGSFDFSSATVTWPSSVSTTQFGYLSGVTSAIQTQLDSKAASASPTITSPTLTSPTISAAVVDTEVVSWTGTETLDPANGSVQEVTLTGNVTTLTDSVADGESIILHIDNSDVGGPFTIAWPTMTWISDDATQVTLNTDKDTFVVVFKSGTTLFGQALNGA